MINLQILGVVLLAASSIADVAAKSNSDLYIGRRSISQDLMYQFMRFTNFSFAAAELECSNPLGTTIVKTINNEATNTQGFIARDDEKKEIIVSFRGTEQVEDILTDLEIRLVPFKSPGVNDTNGARAHQGFLSAHLSVANDVLSVISTELGTYPDYTLISTGHSLGGAVASLTGVSLAANFPDQPLKVFTFGQPRVGDPAYADLAEKLVKVENLFRGVHTSDGVPTMVPQSLGYRHHGTEYWNSKDPSDSIDNVKVCSGQEDPTCSDSIPSTGINDAHFTYFGQSVISDGVDPSGICPGNEGIFGLGL